jgi:hypothetical protein
VTETALPQNVAKLSIERIETVALPASQKVAVESPEDDAAL